MKRKTVKLSEIVKQLPNEWTMPALLELMCSFQRDDNTAEGYKKVVLNTNEWLEFFATHFEWGFDILDRGRDDYEEFQRIFADWRSNNQRQLDRAFTAAVVGYDPISNYDRNETHSRESENTVNRASGKTRKSSGVSYADGAAENVNGGRLTATINSVAADQNAAADLVADYSDGETRKTSEVSANVNTTNSVNGFSVSGIGTNTAGTPVETNRKSRAYDGTVSLDTTDTNTGTVASRSVSAANSDTAEMEAESGNEQGKNTETESIRAYGNIGVTTSAQMVTEEITLRFGLNFPQMCLEWFAKDCLYLGGWSDDCTNW